MFLKSIIQLSQRQSSPAVNRKVRGHKVASAKRHRSAVVEAHEDLQLLQCNGVKFIEGIKSRFVSYILNVTLYDLKPLLTFS